MVPLVHFRNLAIALAVAGVTACAQHFDERALSPASVADAVRQYGEPRTPGQVLADRSNLTGRRIVVDGYLAVNCERIGPGGCETLGEMERFVVMGTQGSLNPGNPQRCAVGVELLLLEPLPATLGTPPGRHVILEATLVDRSETLPHVDETGADAQVIYEYDLALSDVAILALPEDQCN